MKFNQYQIIAGIGITTIAWKYAHNKMSEFSNEINHLVGSTDIIPNEVSQYITPEYFVGVSLASQLFIESCPIGSHSPIVTYAEKTIIGFAYYLPTAFAAGYAENISKQYSADLGIINTIKYVAGVMVGGFVGNLFHNKGLPTIDYGGKFVDKSIAALLLIFTALVGKAKATESPEELSAYNGDVSLLDALDFKNETLGNLLEASLD